MPTLHLAAIHQTLRTNHTRTPCFKVGLECMLIGRRDACEIFEASEIKKLWACLRSKPTDINTKSSIARFYLYVAWKNIVTGNSLQKANFLVGPPTKLRSIRLFGWTRTWWGSFEVRMSAGKGTMPTPSEKHTRNVGYSRHIGQVGQNRLGLWSKSSLTIWTCPLARFGKTVPKFKEPLKYLGMLVW